MFRLLSMGGRLCALLPILLSNLPNTSTGAPLRWEWEPPASTERSEEETADLHCPARGIPPPLIRWSFNAVPFHEWAEDGRRILLDGGKLLRIRTLKRDLDTGLYQCNATSPEGTLAAATFLNVQAFAPHFRHSAHRVWKVLRGTSVDFPCDVRAAPKARVRWVDANDTAIVGVKGKLEFLSNHTLRLNDLSSVDDGFYYCNVSNRYGINRAMNRLEVFNPTYFAEVPQPESLTRDAFESVEFRCRAVADPRLTLEYVWTRDGKRIEQSARTDADGASLLQLNKLRGRNSGRVECSVVTDVDAKTASVHLTVRDVPEPPEVLRVDCSSGQHALVVWRRRAENGAPLTHFTVDALGTRERNANWQKVWEEKVGEEKAKRAMFKAAIPLAPWVSEKQMNRRGGQGTALAGGGRHMWGEGRAWMALAGRGGRGWHLRGEGNGTCGKGRAGMALAGGRERHLRAGEGGDDTCGGRGTALTGGGGGRCR